MSISAAEQYLIELVNRARLNPLAEAERLGMDLNAGLASGTLNGSSRQVLAPDAFLNLAAEGHSQWMLSSGNFSHTGNGGSAPRDRMVAAGYEFTGRWISGENVAIYASTAGRIDAGSVIVSHHESLFRSAGHRQNLLNDGFQEIGVAQGIGRYTDRQSGASYQSTSMLTENFARSGSQVFVTGVAYTDRDANGFYSIGEGVAGVGFTSGTERAPSLAAGGYTLALAAQAGLVDVVVSGSTELRLQLLLTDRNVKLDVVNGTKVLLLGDAVLVTGVTEAQLLGLDDLDLTGGGAAERLVGNAGANVLAGGAGSDTLFGGAGHDTLRGDAGRNALYGGEGNDMVTAGDNGDLIDGGAGHDVLRGGSGSDTIHSGTGNDNIGGGAGNDLIYGESGANIIWAGLGNDTVYGGNGADTIYGSAGRNELYGGEGSDLIHTSWGGDFVGGGAGNDSIFGAEGSDTIYLGLGDDYVGGGAGDDLIVAASGTNRIYGGYGHDSIVAGTGKDVMTGGPGADVFVFNAPDRIGIREGRDVITDFTTGEDKIDLREMPSQFNGTSGLSGGGTASFYHFVSGGLLIGDQNGDGVADWVLELQSVTRVTASDFLL